MVDSRKRLPHIDKFPVVINFPLSTFQYMFSIYPGFFSLYRGFLPGGMRSLVANGVSMLVFDKCQRSRAQARVISHGPHAQGVK